LHKDFAIDPRKVVSKDTKLVIDLDSMLFKLASSAEKSEVKVTIKDTKEEIGVFKNKTEFLGRKKNEICPNSKHNQVNHERISKGLTELSRDDFVIETIKTPVIGYTTMLHNLEEWVDEVCRLTTVPRSNTVYLIGDSGSFRDDICLPKKYKDNRDADSKPLMLSGLRKRFKDKYNPYMNPNLEADDVINIYQFKGYSDYLKTGKASYITSTIDKDAYGCSGFVFNYNKHNGKIIDDSLIKIPNSSEHAGLLFKKDNGDIKGLGFKWFIYQALLFGDTGDHYFTYQYFPHLKGQYGETSACNDLHDIHTSKQVLQHAVDKWKEWHPSGYVEFTCWRGLHHKETWQEFANKIFLCAYMKRSLNDDMNLFKLCKIMGVEI
jgi:hypothetical protein